MTQIINVRAQFDSQGNDGAVRAVDLLVNSIDGLQERADDARQALDRMGDAADGTGTIVDDFNRALEPTNEDLESMGFETIEVSTAIELFTGTVGLAAAAVTAFAATSINAYLSKTGQVVAETEQLNNAFTELQETVGEGLVNVLESGGTSLDHSLNSISADLDTVTALVKNTNAAFKDTDNAISATVAAGGELLAFFMESKPEYNEFVALQQRAVAALEAEEEAATRSASQLFAQFVPGMNAAANSAAGLAYSVANDLTPSMVRGTSVMGSMLNQALQLVGALDILKKMMDDEGKKNPPKRTGGGGARKPKPSKLTKGAQGLGLLKGGRSAAVGLFDGDPNAEAGAGIGGGVGNAFAADSEDVSFLLSGSSLMGGVQQFEGVGSAAQVMGDNIGYAVSETEKMEQSVSALDATLGVLATGGIAAVTDSVDLMVENLARGEGAFSGMGQALLLSLGNLMSQAGKGLILTATGVQAIAGGIPNPAAAIAIGAGMVAFGAALRGFAARGGGGAGPGQGASAGASNTAIDRFDRGGLLRERRTDGNQTTILRIGDREFRAYQQDLTQDLMDRGGVDLTRAMALQGG